MQSVYSTALADWGRHFLELSDELPIKTWSEYIIFIEYIFYTKTFKKVKSWGEKMVKRELFKDA